MKLKHYVYFILSLLIGLSVSGLSVDHAVQAKTTQVSSGKIATFNQGAVTYTNGRFTLYKYTNLTKKQRQQLPQSEYRQLTSKDTAYYLKLKFDLKNTTNETVYTTGFFNDEYEQPDRKDVEIIPSITADKTRLRLKANETKKQQTDLLYLGATKKSAKKLIQNGFYEFEMGELRNQDKHEIADSVKYRIDFTQKKASATSVKAEAPEADD
ncbi:hypothetical protein FHQ08_03045 [Lactobacillus sp. CC-MHH1034]|uniref:hypothetical protein n=1 Tax=Agrilactobacillus fermenti TaxID=2586909 RepID=UPI001E53707A|nr:hypothetical protein [Agrilactobacillus fermenti]MCD2255690.1 hypothetical protein [Agrilactobacillus fermenti]